ncbi:hypothetical protein STEG23_004359, partial [Scotinomys teguina]
KFINFLFKDLYLHKVDFKVILCASSRLAVVKWVTSGCDKLLWQASLGNLAAKPASVQIGQYISPFLHLQTIPIPKWFPEP